MVNKVRVNIAGTPYAIATTDSEKYIQSLAKKLDEDITKLLDENENLSVTKAADVTARHDVQQLLPVRDLPVCSSHSRPSSGIQQRPQHGALVEARVL